MAGKEEIAADLREQIRTGKLPAGEKLPSYRKLADDYESQPNTIGGAIKLLADEGFVTLQTKAPAVVRDLNEAQQTPEAKLADARRELAAIRDGVHGTRQQLNELERQVEGLLEQLGR